LRRKIPIPHLNPPPSQREGGGLGEGVPPISSPSNTDEIGRVIYFFEGPPSIIPPLEKGEDYLPQILPLPLGGGGLRRGRGFPLHAPRFTLNFALTLIFCIIIMNEEG